MPRLSRYSLIAVALLVAVGLGGCKSGSENSYSHITFRTDPIVQCQSDRTVAPASYRTFTWQPSNDSDDPLIERHLVCLARSLLECLGYTYCEDPEGTDFTISVAYDNGYRRTHVPGVPSSGTVWKEDGSIDVMNSDQGGRPGYSYSTFYPEIRFFVSDNERAAKSAHDALVWSGDARATSKRSDIRLTGEMLLVLIMKHFPVCAGGERPERAYGITWAVLSPDGSRFLPTILNVDPGSVAEQAGLRPWDTVDSIDNLRPNGLELPEVRSLLCGGDPEEVALWVGRGRQSTQIILPRPKGLVREKREEGSPNLSHSPFRMSPTIQRERDKTFSFWQSRTFRLRADCDDPALAEHLARVTRGWFEGKGYTYMEAPEADFTVVVTYTPGRGVLSEPTRSVDVPLSDRPDDTVSVSFRAVGVPGATETTYTPELYLFCLDNKRLAAGERDRAVVWRGHVIAAARVADDLLDSQHLLWMMDDWLTSCVPVTAYWSESQSGFTLATATLDGETYYPIVGYASTNANRQPIPLMRGDVVLELNGVPTEGLAVPEAQRLIWEGPEDAISLTVLRGHETKKVVVTRLPAPPPGSLALPPY